MTIVNWYNVGNAEELRKKDVPQIEKTMELEDLGQVNIVFLIGFNLSIIFRGEMLTPNLNGRNPFYTQKTTSYIDPETNDIWVGYAVEV